jgi:hypothetical protein
MADHVFISSTCYDLIDIRAEVETEFRHMRLMPILSDRSTSEFLVAPDANSIENCLANLRRADHVVFILSQRYGPSLSKAGYDDMSATHLEYREARRLKKPIYMYVRDRLEADAALHKKNRGAKLNFGWVSDDSQQLFALLDEHRKLVKKAAESNWLWTFRDSVELKSILRKDFKDKSNRATMEDLIERQRIAFLIPSIKKWSTDKNKERLIATISVVNAGSGAAIQARAVIRGESFSGTDFEWQHNELVDTLLPGSEVTFDIDMDIRLLEAGSKFVLMRFEVKYLTPEGHYIADETDVEFSWCEGLGGMEPAESHYQGKRYWGADQIHLKVLGDD